MPSGTATLSTRPHYWRKLELRKLASQFQTQLDKLVGSEKIATLGGEQETQFEQSLAQLAYNYIADKAPRLLDYMIGFQLVDRQNDNTKAIGVFGFRIGQTWAYAPIFFLNGALKGHELLYLKDHDMFVPLDESWINYVLGQQQNPSLGSSVLGTPQQLGVLQPDIRPLSQPPFMGKRSSAWVQPNVSRAGWLSAASGFAPVYGALTSGSLPEAAQASLAKYADLNVGDLCERFIRLSPQHCKLAMDICETYPAVGRYWEQWHGDAFEKALTDMHGRYKAASPGSLLSDRFPPGVCSGGPVIRLITSRSADLTDKQASELARRGHVIVDERPMEKLSEAFERRESRLTNPTETGIYKLLTKPGEFVRCVIIINPKGSLAAGANKDDQAIAIRLDGDGHNYVICHPGKLFVVADPLEREEYKKWFDGLERGSLDSSDYSKYVLLSPTREGSVVFTVDASHGDGRYEVCERSWSGILDPVPDELMPAFPDGEDYNNQYTFRRKKLQLLNWKEGENTAFRFFDGTLEAPGEAKVIKLSAGDNFLMPGVHVDAEMGIKLKTATLRLRVAGVEAMINSGKPQTKLAALWSLVSEHGFSEATANELLMKAEKAGLTQRDVTFPVVYGEGYQTNKRAYSGLLDGGGISSPAFPDPTMSYGSWSPDTQQQMPMEEEMPIPGMGAQYNDQSIYDISPENQPDPALMQQAQQAGQMGQKELFDTSMLSSMLKNVRQNTQVQTWSKDLLKALDRLGRILFLFYWHNEEFADRYGKSDLPEMEDATRNAFESLGDLALFFKEKDVEPLGAQQMGEASVDAVAD